MSEKRRDNRNRILRNGESQQVVSRVMHKFVCRLRAPSQILPHHTADGFGGLDLHGVGGVGEGVGV